MKNAFDGLLSRLDMVDKGLSELDISIECLKTKNLREQNLKKTEQNIQGLWDNYKS